MDMESALKIKIVFLKHSLLLKNPDINKAVESGYPLLKKLSKNLVERLLLIVRLMTTPHFMSVYQKHSLFNAYGVHDIYSKDCFMVFI